MKHIKKVTVAKANVFDAIWDWFGRVGDFLFKWF